MSEIADALDALLKSEGWRLFAEHAKAEWGPGACWRKAKAVTASSISQNEAIERIDYTNQQVGELMEWPQQQMLKLRREAALASREPAMSRRGSL